MWQSELFCFTCCLSRGLCLCVDLSGGIERERERKHIKGKREQGQVTFTQQVQTTKILLKIDELNLYIPTKLKLIRSLRAPLPLS